jgi:hypothetical protein
MAKNRRRRNRFRQAANGLPEVAYQFFAVGPFWEAEDFEQQTSAEERDEIWKVYRAAIIDRWRLENPANADLETWGETLERLKEAGIGNQ